MVLEFVILILSLFTLLESLYIVFRTKREIDKTFKFLSAAIIIFSLRTLFSLGEYSGVEVLKYFDLLFIIVMLLGLSFMMDHQEIKKEVNYLEKQVPKAKTQHPTQVLRSKKYKSAALAVPKTKLSEKSKISDKKKIVKSSKIEKVTSPAKNKKTRS